MNENIRRDEAAQRSDVLRVRDYEVALDLRDQSTATFPVRTTVRFASTTDLSWIDLIAADVDRIELNGRTLDPASYDGARIPLPGLRADNELVVAARCTYMRTGEGLHRSVDPADGATYLYTQMATADARRVFPCFDQPDLKAHLSWDVRAPAQWDVVSTTVPGDPAEVEPGIRRWRFPPTPPLPTYLAVLVAGPFHAVRSTYDGPHGTYPMAVLARRSMAAHLDAEEFLDITRRGLAHFEAAFAVPYPFAKYDQVLVPEFNLGAMENPGAVTFREDSYLFRSRVTRAARESRANVILHEMAHMWFGDLVTMRWWDDLWLNESFAEWAGTWAAARATDHRQAWTTFAQARKAWAYQQDQLPTTHPVVADMVDLDAVYLNFDGITYAKGAAVLKQLVAWVGERDFLTGLRRYFERHAWGSTTLADLLRELERASGRDLASWAAAWLEQPGVTTLQPVVEVDEHGCYRRVTLQQRPPDRPEGVQALLRPHRVAVATYRWADTPGGRRLVRDRRVEVDVVGALTEVPSLAGSPGADLLLANDDDLTYAKVRFDPRSLATARQSVGRLADSLPRAVVWGSLWELVRDGQIPAQDFVEAALTNLADEDRPGIIETVLRQTHSARVRFVAPALAQHLASRICEATAELLSAARPWSDRQLALARSHISCAVDPGRLRRLSGLLDGTEVIAGLPLDPDLRWEIVSRLCARGAGGPDLVAAELERDPTTKGRQAAARARAAVPTPAAKEAAWNEVVVVGGLSNALLAQAIAGFADPEHPELLAPFRGRYVEAVRGLWAHRSPAEATSLARGLFPEAVVEPETLAAADLLLADPDLPTGLRRIVVEGRDAVQVALACRAVSAAAAGRAGHGAGAAAAR